MGNMKLVAYSDEKYTAKVPGGSYEVMLNPEKLQWGRQVQYNEEAALDSSAPSAKYNKTPSETLSFELVIDCTGVVDDSRVDLPTEIANLSKVVYDYNGSIHRPNYVSVNWGGGLAFRGVLTSLSTSYTLFKPDGTPLRARLSLAFISYIDAQTLANKDDKSSPDMTHQVRVVDGDSLAQIVAGIYGEPGYYIQVARFNQLDKFRRLKTGQVLSVPPLKPQEAING
ncbi:hypothetical protein KSS94_21520 [Pseudomonas fakonensis]|uniref:LysM domain-containing protein n=1 Tax=Pseudomonas fakonensis TaxID=2842355 RepID=A0ABX8N2D5_9PSED|nr:hypothetical protein [Pseudomonas fakonensis]QXH50498.1 hypothetical protein KSS94_21520 [Pseudomonas fakonensis]